MHSVKVYFVFTRAIHQVMIIEKNTHGLTKNAEKAPEDHISHLALENKKY